MRRNPAGRLAVTALGLLAVVAAARGVTAQEKPASDENWKPEGHQPQGAAEGHDARSDRDDHEAGYAESLSVGCVACHKGKVDAPLSTFDFADDGKENKDVTRSMIAMTRDINTKYPEGLPNASEKEPAVDLRDLPSQEPPSETDASAEGPRRGGCPKGLEPPHPPLSPGRARGRTGRGACVSARPTRLR